MNYYIVCDAGGTKADFLLFNGEGKVMGKYKTSGANATFVGQQAAIKSILEGIKQCLFQADMRIDAVHTIALFIPGFKKCIEILKEELCFPNIVLAGDEDNALYGALGKGSGIVVLSGTGSFAIGRNSKEEIAVCGGWGPLFGDYGSGYHIGIMCLSTLVKIHDNGVSNTTLEKMVLERLNIQNVGQLRYIAYKEDFTRSKIADLCKVVGKAALAGDTYAKGIIEAAARELVNLAVTISKRIELENLEVSLIGGVSNMGDLISNEFKKYLKYELPEYSYVDSKYTPAIGAALYVLENIENKDIEDQDIIKNLTEKG